jgi:hypothetical protein
MNDDHTVDFHEMLRKYTRQDADETRKIIDRFTKVASDTAEKSFLFGDLYGADPKKLDKLEGQRAYAEAEADHEVEVVYDQYQNGILTLDEMQEMVTDAEARRIKDTPREF